MTDNSRLERKRAAHKRWYQKNKEREAERRKEYYEANREELLEKQRAKYQEDRESRLEKAKKWRQNNRHKKAAQQAKRSAKKRGATPDWLTKEMLGEIEYMYFLARDVSLITGEPHQVDHIVPLQGENICGLHVPWNLQVLTAEENRRKSNRME